MWKDIYDENFVDMMLLLSIPGISIGLTVIVVVVKALYERTRRRRDKLNPPLEDPEELHNHQKAVEEVRREIIKAEVEATRAKFGLEADLQG